MTDHDITDALDELSEAETIALALALVLNETPAAGLMAGMERPQLTRLADAAEQFAGLIRAGLAIPQPGTPEADREAVIARLAYAAAQLAATAVPQTIGTRVSERHLATLADAVDQLSPGLAARIRV